MFYNPLVFMWGGGVMMQIPQNVGFIMYARHPQVPGINEHFCAAPEHHDAA